MNVIAHDVFVDPQKADDIKFLSLDELFGQSDVISLHCPLTKENEKIIKTSMKIIFYLTYTCLVKYY